METTLTEWTPIYFILNNWPGDYPIIQFGHIIQRDGLSKRIKYTDRDCQQRIAHTPLTFTAWDEARDYLISTGEYTPLPAH